MTGGEMAGASAFVAVVLKTLIDFFLKIFDKMAPPKLTPADVENMKWKTNLEGVLDETRKLLERMNDKGDERAKTLDDVYSITQRDHRHLGEIKDHMTTLTTQIASGDFCKGVK